VLVLFMVYGQMWTQDAAHAGLVQRILVVTGWTWLMLLAVRLLRRRTGHDVDPAAARSTSG
jgi:hypothetical protein